MSLVVLLILAALWGVFLIPQILRARVERGPADSIGSFRNQLSMIERSLPGAPVSRARVAPPRTVAMGYVGVPYAGSVGAPMRSASPMPTRSELQRRRQSVLLALLGAVVVTLALGLLFRPAFALNIVADVALASYVALLVRARTIAAERETKVRYLPGPMSAPAVSYGAEPALRTVAR